MPRLKLNYREVGRFLKSAESAAAVKAKADEIAARTGDDETIVEEYTTDRAVAGVVVPADKQAKYGLATRARNA